MKITDLGEAKKLRDRMKTEHERLAQWRMVRDRNMDGTLNTVKQILPERVKGLFVPVQSQEPDDEIQARKQVLASNSAEIECVSRSKQPKVTKLAADYEDALEALHEHLFPIETQLDECDGFLGDGKTVVALDYLGPGEALGKYADRAKLELAAEQYAMGSTAGLGGERGQESTPTPESEPPGDATVEASEPAASFDDDDDSPEATYARAYVELGMDHEKAYDRVTHEAMVLDGCRYRVRIIETDTWDSFDDVDGVNIGMEDGEIEIHPALRTLEEYGVTQVGTKIVLTGPGADDDDDEALAPRASGTNATGALSVEGQDKIRYTQIRTREQIIIIADRPAGGDTDGEGIFITFDTPLDDHTGYFVIEGDTKLRAGDQRCQPVVLGLLETHQRLNMLKSVVMAMALDEGTRDVFAAQTTAGVAPIDPTQEVKGQQVENGTPAPEVPDLKRVETTGIDLEKIIAQTTAETERYKMHESFTGIGDSGETGIHLARMLTAYAMRLQPQQTKRARVHKEVLMCVSKAIVKSGVSVMVPYLPAGARGVDDGIRVAEPREITPEMCKAPIDVQVKIGAESDETRYAAMQMSQAATQFGTWSMTEHRRNSGVKDPHAMEAEILEDNIVADAIGGKGQPGWMIPFVRQTAEEIISALIESLLPAPPAPGADMTQGGGPGLTAQPGEQTQTPNPSGLGPAEVGPPTQTLPGGLPAVSGMGGAAT